MTPAQRESLSSLIVRATVGKYTLGMDLPAHWRNWNHLGLTESYAACMFAIEGEPADNNYGFQGKTDLAPAKGDRLLLVRTLDLGMPELPI